MTLKNAYFSEMLNEIWAMEERSLQTFLARIAEIGPEDIARVTANVPEFYLNKKDQLAAISKEDTGPGYEIRGNGLAVIPIEGVLMKKVPWFYRFFEISATQYGDIRNALTNAVKDPDVEKIVLHIDSPGGTVSGAEETADAIFEARKIKPVHTHIEDLGASAAFYTGSQANTISTNKNGEVGSIGVYAVFVDGSKAAEEDGFKIIVIKSGEHKGMGVPGAPITDAQIKAEQKIVDGLNDNFIQAVSRGRGMNKKEVRALATGQTWLGEEAVEIGLVDSISDINSILVTDGPSKLFKKGSEMTDEEKKAADEKAAVEKVKKESADAAKKEEQKRAADLKEEFSDDPEFALEAIEKGMSVTDAKVLYCDKLREQNAALQKKVDEGGSEKEEGTGHSGASKMPKGKKEEEEGDEDFMTMRDNLVQKHGWSLGEASSYISTNRPKVYNAYLASIGARPEEK